MYSLHVHALRIDMSVQVHCALRHDALCQARSVSAGIAECITENG
jgi:hypothetical protein